MHVDRIGPALLRDRLSASPTHACMWTFAVLIALAGLKPFPTSRLTPTGFRPQLLAYYAVLSAFLCSSYPAFVFKDLDVCSPPSLLLADAFTQQLPAP